MNTFKLIALSIIAVIFAACKASQPTGPPSGGPTPSLLEVTQILNSTDSTFLAYSSLNNGNPHLSIMQTAAWVQSQPNVQSATTLDSVYITIVLKSGIRTTFAFDETDSAGNSLFKGGGPGAGGSHLARFGPLSNNTITNKNVLIYCAGYSQFYRTNNAIQSTANILQGAGLNVTLLKDADCTYQAVNTFPNYGFVIIDTHGMPDAFLIGTYIKMDNTLVTDDLFKASIVAQGGQDMLDKLLSGELSFFTRVQGNTLTPYWKIAYRPNTVLNIFLTTRYIDNILPPMPNTVIMGSMCYSGWQSPLGTGYTPIETSFMNRNPISYYCFAFDNGTSAPVSVRFGKWMEDSLAHALASDLDSTKIANLEPDHETEYSDPFHPSSPLYFKHFGADDYSYPHANTFVDARDGQVYREVTIGAQTWMAQNLNFDAPGAVCYDNDSRNCAIFGKLYPWDVLMNGAPSDSSNPSKVQGLCPKGWHVPSLAEWNQLFVAAGDTVYYGNQPFGNAPIVLESASTDTAGGGWISRAPTFVRTNSSGFSALPGGDFIWTQTPYPTSPLARKYWMKSAVGMFQSSTLVSAGQPWAGAVNAIQFGPGNEIIVIHSDGNSDVNDPNQPHMNASCRCVKDP